MAESDAHRWCRCGNMPRNRPVSAEMGDEMAEMKDELAAPEAAVQTAAVTGSFPL